VDIYDPATGWSTTTLSQGRGYLAAASAGGKVLFGGGMPAADWASSSDAVDIYDAGTGTLLRTDHLSQARYGLSATSANGMIFFAGGWTGTNFSDVVNIYDTGTGTWLPPEHLSQARSDMAATSAADRYVFFAGGSTVAGTHDQGSSVVDIYDTVTRTWLPPETLSVARDHLTATSVGDQIFFAGGYENGGAVSSIVNIYTIPEPATLSLLAMGGLAVLRRRRK